MDFNYPQGTEPGEWRFTPDSPVQLAFAPNWGKVTPFVLKRGSQFRPAPPYHLGSKNTRLDYNEIKLIGGDDITTPSARTPDQTEIGLFWIESSPLAWNRLARAISVEQESRSRGRTRGCSGSSTWRWPMAISRRGKPSITTTSGGPITAIRLGDTDGNPDTDGVPDWTPLQSTYPMPDHDSGHAVQGGVAAEILKQFFGTDDISFTACSTTVGADSTCADPAPVIRSYSSFSQAADENAVSRIYIGIHFRRAVEEGVRHGRKIGAYAVHSS